MQDSGARSLSSDSIPLTGASPLALSHLAAGGPLEGLPPEQSKVLFGMAELLAFQPGRPIVEQYHRAERFYLLVQGRVEFKLTLEAAGQQLSVGESGEPWTPVGWSAFRAPHRYATSVTAQTYAEVLSFSVVQLREYFDLEPSVGARFFRAVVQSAGALLDEARERLIERLRPETTIANWRAEAGVARSRTRRIRSLRSFEPLDAEPSRAPVPISPQESMVTHAAPPIGEILQRSSFFDELPEELLGVLGPLASVEYFCRGDVIQRQGSAGTDLIVLADGKVRLEYQGRRGVAAGISSLNDSGEVLSWGRNLARKVTLRAIDDGSVFRFRADALDALFDEHPRWGQLFEERSLWLIGRRLQRTRAHLVSESFDQEQLAVENVLEQVRTELRVSSELHKVPHLLRASVTVADALKVVDVCRKSSDKLEAQLADLCHELLKPIRRETRFFSGLQASFEEVVRAPSSTAAVNLRRVNAESFIRVFSEIPSVVRGLEHLPTTPGHIFVFNHLKNHPDNTLPNGFQLTLDSHFLSSMILHRTYGDPGVRVVRNSRVNEYGHQAYYERLGHVMVYTRDSDTPQQGRTDRFKEFITTAESHLREGTNLLLAPEGTSLSTESSPGPFKAGAFRLAASVANEPLVVPIAVANFDRRLGNNKLVAVVQKPFRVSERVENMNDPLQGRAFLADFHAEFRGWVSEAVALGQESSGE